MKPRKPITPRHPIAQAIERLRGPVQRGEYPCFLCGRRAVYVGAYLPDDAEASGLGRPPAGKQRAAIYGLCEMHAFDAGRVEHKLQKVGGTR